MDLGVAFAGLLGWLGTQALSDLADLFHEPQLHEFRQAERAALEQERSCPNCERDYLIGQELSVDLSLGRKGATRHYDTRAVRPHHCPACGLALFCNCSACAHEQLVHLEHCGACGAPWQAERAVSPAS